MWRFIVLISTVFIAAIIAGTQVKNSDGVAISHDLASLKAAECLGYETPSRSVIARNIMLPEAGYDQQSQNLSISDFIVTLGIGLLTILCFVPAVLLMELFLSRGKDCDSANNSQIM